MMGNPPITLCLKIHNAYAREDYPDHTRTVAITVPAPPCPATEPIAEPDAYQEWAWDNIRAEAGDARYPHGDSWHDVTVLASSHPTLVPEGTHWDWGY